MREAASCREESVMTHQLGMVLAAVAFGATGALFALEPVRATEWAPARPTAEHLARELPLYFEPTGAGFVSHGSEYVLAVSPDRANVTLGDASFVIRLVGGDAQSPIEGLDRLPGTSNYFLGRDPRRWRSGVPHYARVRFRSVYPGIDLVYHADRRHLEFDFIVQPSEDPAAIRLSIEGAESVQLDDHDGIVLRAKNKELRLSNPTVYQEAAGERRSVDGRFVMVPEVPNVVAFELGEYDETLALIIDPQLEYSTYLGGSASESANAVGRDAFGNFYVAGITGSANFPVHDAFQPLQGGGSFDAFVTKFSPDGSTLVYSTYLGGIGAFDQVYAMAVDAVGNVYLAGETTSADFPTVNPIQGVYMSNTDGFVAKVSADGSALVYSTYLGGSLADQVLDIAVDETGAASVTGHTVSSNFPTKDALQASHGGGFYDAFVAKISTEGSALVYSTYLGGVLSDEARGIALDRAGNVYLTGDTRSVDFPTTPLALQPIKSGDADVFVTKITADGQTLLYSTFLGGSGTDESFGLKLIALDPAGNIYVTGNTFSDDFPTVNPIQAGPSGESDVFVAKIKADGSAIVYSTYLGSSAYDDGLSIEVDAWGNAHVAGYTLGSGFPILNAPQPVFGGASDAIVLEINPTGGLVYSSFLGGLHNERANDLVLDASGDLYITGQVWSNNFPTVNPYQDRIKGPQDGFAAKISVAHPPLEVASLSWSSASTLQWTAATDADMYGVYRGEGTELSKLLSDELDSCLAIQTSGLDSGPVLTEIPVPASFHWYLVRGENAVGLGLVGSASAGPRILDSSGGCP
jgi:hypothetical protein